MAAGEDAPVHAGMEGLDPPVEHLGEAGDLGNAGDGEARLAEGPRRAAGRHELDTEAGQGPGEFHEP